MKSISASIPASLSASLSAISLVVMGLLALPVFPYPAAGDTNESSSSQLKADWVVQKDGKFVIDRFQLCQVFRPEDLGGGVTKPFQVSAHIEAPTDVISRDSFVGIGTELALSLRVNFASDIIKGLTPMQALEALQCKQIATPIGTVDLEVDVFMTGDGIQIEIVETATGQKQRETTSWAQVLGE